MQLVIEIILAIVFIGWFAWYLFKERKQLVYEKVWSVGTFPVLQAILLKKQWGIQFIESIVTKSPKTSYWFTRVSYWFSYIGIVLGLVLLLMMAYLFFLNPGMVQVSLVLPFTEPVPATAETPSLGMLLFTHWLLALGIGIALHELGHALVSRYFGLALKSTGIGALCLWKIPVLPLAFVEPDEKALEQMTPKRQLAVYAAGPFMNIVLFLLVFVPVAVFSLPTNMYVFWFCVLNLSLGLTNLLPIPMLDGGHLFKQVCKQFDISPKVTQTVFWGVFLLLGCIIFVPFFV